MKICNRRQVLKGAAAGVALIGAPPLAFASPAKLPMFVFDGRFAQAIDEAEVWRARGAETIDSREVDLGRAWRDRIPEWLAAGGHLTGMTLWVDSFICETFGRDHGLQLLRMNAGLGHGLGLWTLG